ncbi:MAG: hypothetical protein EZS28_012476 [Streblomastix strix]|uniref:Uncharacterized protein n=1 Tax=Streblomastix strix TaxID=222440 RepID=A0A5J4WBQ5_9EUKA|nr:MAG: hypothetical protein EZS28_012476 [Streblomastix strix]
MRKELIKENSTLIKQKDDLANFLRRKIKELEDREEEIKRDGISKERISIGIPGVEKSHLVNHIKSLQVEKAKKEDEIKQQKLKLEKQNILIEEGQEIRKKALQNASTKLNKVTKELIDDTADQDEQEQRLVEKCSELKIDNQELQYHLEDLQQMLESSNQNLAIHSEINHRNNHKIANQAKIIEQFNNRIKKMKDELERDKRNLNKRLELEFNDQYSEVNETEIEQRNKRQFEQNNNPKLISTISPVRNNKELKDINRTQSSQDIFRRENIQGNIIREGVDQIIDDNEGSRIRAQTSFEMRPQFLRKREGHGCGPGSISRLTQFQMYLTEHENLVKERASQLGHTNSRQILYMQQLQKEVMNTRKKEKEKEDEDRVKQLIQDRDKAKAVDGVIVSGEENKDKYLFDHLAQRDFILGPNALDKEKQFIATKLSTGEKQREEEMKIQENDQNKANRQYLMQKERQQMPEETIAAIYKPFTKQRGKYEYIPLSWPDKLHVLHILFSKLNAIENLQK